VSFAALRELPDAGTLDAAAGSMRTFGSSTTTAIDGVSTAWKGLAGADVYDTPERGTVLDAMHTPALIAAMIEQNAQSAASALATYASTLTALATRRTNLVADLAAFAAAPAPAPDPASPTGEPSAADTAAATAKQQDLSSRVDHFNADADQADQDCADALGKLHKYDADTVSQFLEYVGGDTRSGLVIGLGSGVVEGTLERWRRILTVPASAVPVQLTVPPAADWVNGRPAWNGPNGLLLTEPPAPKPFELGPGVKGHSTFVGDPDVSLGALPKVAKVGGKVLGVAGVALTLGVAYDEQWTADAQSHPEWSTSRRVESATENTVIVGGTTALSGAAGAAVGAGVGAAIGTAIFPGVGTVIGGIIGGVGVGFAMSDFGQDLGNDIKGWYDGSAAQKTVHHVWKDLFG
jgi:hypothetical protein